MKATGDESRLILILSQLKRTTPEQGRFKARANRAQVLDRNGGLVSVLNSTLSREAIKRNYKMGSLDEKLNSSPLFSLWGTFLPSAEMGGEEEIRTFGIQISIEIVHSFEGLLVFIAES
ncbi:hypothetical protein TNCV_2357531 [Trichonephila clavipes]|nr:hypothetical protein TNCV_2357531 [Trichonephila clavipes]